MCSVEYLLAVIYGPSSLSLFAGLNFQSSDCSSLEIMSKAALT